jgi:uncharacterized protein (TIGR02217 family)
MSNSILPSFPGLTWNVMRTPIFNTAVKSSVSMREFRASLTAYPVWQYKLTYEVLRARSALPEMQQLAGFFLQRSGSFDTWLYTDPDDNTVALQGFGVGDGTTTQFQLVRSFGGFTEPIYDINGTPSIYKAGVLQGSGYSINATGLVTFTVAPTGGQALTWTGSYYFRCRFLKDQLEFNQFMKQFWELRTMEFKTVKP